MNGRVPMVTLVKVKQASHPFIVIISHPKWENRPTGGISLPQIYVAELGFENRLLSCKILVASTKSFYESHL